MTAPSPTSYLVMLCITLLLPILLALSRHFIKHTRHYTYQPLSKAHLLTEIFYYTAICTHLAMISMLIYRTSTEVRLENHFRTHHPTLPPAIRDERIFQAMTTQKMLLVLFASGCCYYSALCLIKGAFLAFYWGLYTRAGIAHKWIKVAIALTLVLVGSTFLVGLLWCRPIYRNWSSDYEDYVKCTSVNSLAVRIVGTTASVVGDVASAFSIPPPFSVSIALTTPRSYPPPHLPAIPPDPRPPRKSRPRPRLLDRPGLGNRLHHLARQPRHLLLPQPKVAQRRAQHGDVDHRRDHIGYLCVFAAGV